MSVSPPTSEYSVWSSASAASRKELLCLVCGGPARGIHFQVSTCRACAAFFRRSVEQGQKYKCRRGTLKCDVSKASSMNCRRCRFEQCKMVGMVFLVPQKSSRSRSDATEIAIPLKPSYDNLAEFKKSVAAVLCNSSCQLSIQNLDQPTTSIMQPLLVAYNSLKPKNSADLIISNTVDYFEHVNFQKMFIHRIAKWAMISPEFQNLPFEDKWIMLRSFWHPMYHIERCARTMEVGGDEWVPCAYLMTDEVLVNFSTFRFTGFDASTTEEGIDTAHRYFAPIRRHLISSIMEPLKKMRVTDFEVVFLCIYKMWSVHKLKGISTQTVQLAEVMKDRLTDELHEYYMNESYSKNYAPQLANLMMVLTDLEVFLRARRNADLSAEVLQIFQCDFRNSEFFEDQTD